MSKKPADGDGPILLVEPDDLIRELLERWLREAAYRVQTCTLPTLACIASAAPPRLIITDVPDSQAAAAIIATVRRSYSSPILVLSARFRRGLGASAEVARRLGVTRVLPKPFTRVELLAAVGESIA